MAINGASLVGMLLIIPRLFGDIGPFIWSLLLMGALDLIIAFWLLSGMK